MPKRNILLLSILLPLFQCSIPERLKNNIEEESTRDFNFPIIIDVEESGEMHKKQEIRYGRGFYQVAYIGNLVDTIVLTHRLSPPILPPLSLEKDTLPYLSFPDAYPGYYIDWNDSRYYEEADSSQLIIKIDASQSINDNGILSYPIVMFNTSTDTVTIGYGNRIGCYIPLRMEAMDKDENWKPIKTPFMLCGNGAGAIILPPNDIVVTSANVYSGEFKTKLRMSFGKSLSNEIVGYIDTTQFKQQVY